MVEKREYINYAASLEENTNIKYGTTMKMIIELSKKIKELEVRIIELEKDKVTELK